MAFPSDLVRTKNWGTEVLTDSDLEGQFDLIINWVMAALDLTSGHDHSAASNMGPKISAATGLKIASQAQGDVLYASSASAWARLGAGTSGQFLKTNGAAANPSWGDAPAGGVLGDYKNLLIVRNSVTQVTVTADELILEDSSNNKVTIRSVSEAIAITTSGASGLDTGAEASGTWYYIWIIRKSSDGTVNGLLSTSSSAPTMPSGYDQKALVSAVRNDGSSNFIDFIQSGPEYHYVAWQQMDSGSKTITVWTSITTSAFVPSALSTFLYGAIYPGGVNAIASNENSSTANATTYAVNKYIWRNSGTIESMLPFDMPIHTANTVYWSNDTGASAAIWCRGFRINKLS